MEHLQKLKIGQSVSIALQTTNELNGVFYCYDPESHSVIIQDSDDNLIWINGHNINSITSLEQKTTLHNNALLNKIESESAELLHNDKKKECKLSVKTIEIQSKLMKFLEEHQLSPILDENTNKINIGSSLYIIPPYDTSCCRSSNEIILSMLLNLLNEFYAKAHHEEEEEEHQTESEDVLEID